MKEKVTVVLDDALVIVEDMLLQIEGLGVVPITDEISSDSVHAIQWANEKGHVEFKDDAVPNTSLTGEDDYAVWVAPFVILWEAEKARLEAAEAQAEAEALTTYNSTEARAERVRTERDSRITACDWVISRHAEQVASGVDTTLTSDEYAAWLTYRQELRDLPSEDCFPWDGGGENTPWPTQPQN